MRGRGIILSIPYNGGEFVISKGRINYQAVLVFELRKTILAL